MIGLGFDLVLRPDDKDDREDLSLVYVLVDWDREPPTLAIVEEGKLGVRYLSSYLEVELEVYRGSGKFVSKGRETV